ncbi:MAG TPA: ABC transporter ATP-binding protein [Solirubrobacteraceae bacterium]|nr:ABC transporter ATP-binding protein [Solirubrobacteraceae bacterium]
MSALYELDGVVKRYGTGNAQVTAVGGADLRVEAGEFLALVGPSGSGKTTLLQLLGAMDRPSDGRLAFEGRELGGLGDGELSRLRREAIGFVFQQFNLIPTLTAEQNVAAALAPVRMKTAARRQRARELLGRVRLEHRLGNLPSQLSGGEQQRVAIARALANRPRVLLADEPTGNLDSATGAEIVTLLRALSTDEGLTVILVTHDQAVAGAADRVVGVRDGVLREAVAS